MQVYDIIMLVVLLITIFFGYLRGLAWQIASLSAIFVSYFVAIRYREVVAVRIEAEQPWNMFLAMLILFVASSLAIWIMFQFVKRIIDRAKLKDFDQQMGAMFGAVKGVVLCMVITFFALTLLGPNQKQRIVNSRSGYVIAHILNKSKMVMPRELSEVLGPYLQRLDDKLSPDQNQNAPTEGSGDELLDAITDEFTNRTQNELDVESIDDLFPVDDEARISRDKEDRYVEPHSEEFSRPYRR